MLNDRKRNYRRRDRRFKRHGVVFSLVLCLGLSFLLLSGRAALAQGQSLKQLTDACDNTADHKSATKACRAVLASPDAENDDKVAAWVSLAQFAAKEDRFNDALDAVNAAMRIGPRDCTLFIARGVLQWALNKPDAALRDLTEANRVSQDGLCVDNMQEPLERRGDLYFWLGEYQRAAADYDQVLQHRHMASKNIPVMLFLANRHLGRSDTATLKESLSELVSDKRAAKFVGWSPFDDVLQSTLLGEGDRVVLLAAALSSDTETNASQFSEAYFVLAELEALRGDFATARADYRASEQFDSKGMGMLAKAQASRLPAASTLRESSQGGVVSRPIPQAGHYYALVIGISDYPGTLRLDTPRADATAIGDVLQRRYNFQVKVLLDSQATRSGILRAVKEYKNQLRPEDSLLIYYAGHGDKQADKAYWLPVDADSADSSNAIIADELTASISAQATNHVLVIADSCYSGEMTRDPNFPVPALVTAAYLEQMQARKSRTLMASGGNEPVSDGGGSGHSIFAAALLRALEEGDGASFTAGQLFFARIQQPVGGKSHQMPQYEYLRASGHDGGDFVFIRQAAHP